MKKIVIFKYNPIVIKLNSILKEKDVIAIAPEQLREKYLNFENIDNVIFIKNFELKTVYTKILEIQNQHKLSDIFTLSEDDMEWVGFLRDVFITKNKSDYITSTLMKNKYYMRTYLMNVVKQPDFYENVNEEVDSNWLIKDKSSQGAKNITEFQNNKSRNNNNYYEKKVKYNFMVICDGIYDNGNMNYFFVNEYEEKISDSIKNSSNITIRTSRLYWENYNLIIELYNQCSKILNKLCEFKTSNIIPFHFEFFIDEFNNISFCEVGMRFGGGNIPNIINHAFDIDINDIYWKKISLKRDVEEIHELLFPKRISFSYLEMQKEGRLIMDIDKDLYSDSINYWIFAQKNTIYPKPSDVTNILSISEYKVNNEQEYTNLKNKLKRDSSKAWVTQI